MKLRHDIASFSQQDGETLYEAWERYKDLLRRCPQHGLSGWMEVQTFYQGLNQNVKQTIDATPGGYVGNKTTYEARKFLEYIRMNSYQWNLRAK